MRRRATSALDRLADGARRDHRGGAAHQCRLPRGALRGAPEFRAGRLRHRLHRPATWRRSAPSRAADRRGRGAGGALALVRERERRGAQFRHQRGRDGARGRGTSPTASRCPARAGADLALVVEGERVDAMLGWDEDGPSLDMIGDEAARRRRAGVHAGAGRGRHDRAVGRAADGGAALRSALRVARRGATAAAS